MADVMLEVRGLRHTFHPGTPAEMRALQGIDLVLPRGAFAIALGTNGSGKSTCSTRSPDRSCPITARSCSAARTSPAGRSTGGRPLVRPGLPEPVQWDGARHDGRREPRACRASKPPGRAGPGAEPAAPARDRRGRWERLGLGLERRLDAPIGLLSGGQRQALTLLMATFERPQLLLLDEHTAALDPRSAEQVVRLTQDIVSRLRLTTLMVTHSLPQAVRLGIACS